MDSNKDGLLTEKELKGLSTDIIEEAFGHTPPGEVIVISILLINSHSHKQHTQL